MAMKQYGYNIPHATFIDSRGRVHSFNGAGRLATDDALVQNEIEAAIKVGQQFTIIDDAVAAPVGNQQEPIDLQAVKQQEPETAAAATAAALAALKAGKK